MIEDNYEQRYAGFNPNSSESYIIFEFVQDKNMEKSVKLATLIQKQFKNTAKRIDKGVHQAGFLVLRATSMPSVLVELGYISTPDEEQYLLSDAGTTALSNSIYKAFLNYKREHDAPIGRSRVQEQELPEPENKPKESRIEIQTAEPDTATEPDKITKKPVPATQKKITGDQARTSAKPVFKIQILVSNIGGSDSTFRAIRIKNGKVVWTYTGIKGYIETKPLVEGDKVIFGAWDNTLYALNKSNGKELWKWTGGLTRMHFSPAAVWPVAAHGKVFITDPQRAMTAISLKTGKTVWRTFQSMVRETIGLSANKNQIYSKTMNDSVVCYSTISDTPKEIWASNVGFGYEHAPSMQMEKDGIVFSSTKEGLIFALDASTGQVLWKHKIGNSLINTVLPISRHQVLFTATSGETGLLEWKE